jgi:hypothetical protein
LTLAEQVRHISFEFDLKIARFHLQYPSRRMSFSDDSQQREEEDDGWETVGERKAAKTKAKAAEYESVASAGAGSKTASKAASKKAAKASEPTTTTKPAAAPVVSSEPVYVPPVPSPILGPSRELFKPHYAAEPLGPPAKSPTSSSAVKSHGRGTAHPQRYGADDFDYDEWRSDREATGHHGSASASASASAVMAAAQAAKAKAKKAEAAHKLAAAAQAKALAERNDAAPAKASSAEEALLSKVRDALAHNKPASNALFDVAANNNYIVEAGAFHSLVTVLAGCGVLGVSAKPSQHSREMPDLLLKGPRCGRSHAVIMPSGGPKAPINPGSVVAFRNLLLEEGLNVKKV